MKFKFLILSFFFPFILSAQSERFKVINYQADSVSVDTVEVAFILLKEYMTVNIMSEQVDIFSPNLQVEYGYIANGYFDLYWKPVDPSEVVLIKPREKKNK